MLVSCRERLRQLPVASLSSGRRAVWDAGPAAFQLTESIVACADERYIGLTTNRRHKGLRSVGLRSSV